MKHKPYMDYDREGLVQLCSILYDSLDARDQEIKKLDRWLVILIPYTIVSLVTIILAALYV